MPSEMGECRYHQSFTSISLFRQVILRGNSLICHARSTPLPCPRSKKSHICAGGVSRSRGVERHCLHSVRSVGVIQTSFLWQRRRDVRESARAGCVTISKDSKALQGPPFSKRRLSALTAWPDVKRRGWSPILKNRITRCNALLLTRHLADKMEGIP
jgi:hypothetical protein